MCKIMKGKKSGGMEGDYKVPSFLCGPIDTDRSRVDFCVSEGKSARGHSVEGGRALRIQKGCHQTMGIVSES